MLLDSVEAIPGVKSQIRSPSITPPSGCLDLNFHYYLYGTSKTMELSVHTVTTGKKLHSYSFSDRGMDSMEKLGCIEFVSLFDRWEPWTYFTHHPGKPGSRLETCRSPLPGNCCHSGQCQSCNVCAYNYFDLIIIFVLYLF